MRFPADVWLMSLCGYFPATVHLSSTGQLPKGRLYKDSFRLNMNIHIYIYIYIYILETYINYIYIYILLYILY